MTFFDKEGNPINENGLEPVRRVDYSRPIPDAPIHRGFDEFFGTVSCPTTDWLYAYVEGDRIPNPPTKILDQSPLPKHPYSQDNRRGMIAPGFDLEEVDLVFLEKSLNFIKNHVRKRPNQPFFLFHSTQAVHLPSFPADQFKGKTTAGPHGDFIFELDAIVGTLTETLENLGIADRTLVLFSSDNGPEVTPTIRMRTDYGHDGARPWRGMKRDGWEGGHRVPLIASWPGKIKAGSTTDQILSLTDIMATLAALINASLPNTAAEDSINFLPVLLGTQGEKPIRNYLLQQTNQLALSIRKGPWKYLNHRGSGGNRYNQARLQRFVLPETAPEAPGQLYNLELDPGETKNLYFERPDILQKLRTQLDHYVNSGRSAPVRK